jgi:predicted nucleotidyltransferase component of viral defense system
MIRKNITGIIEKQLAQLLRCSILPGNSYLAGGTAVYFYLKHRVSVDLDFFTPAHFNSENFVFQVRQCFENFVTVELMEKDTIILYISNEKIKFSLFHLPYKLLSKVQSFNIEHGVSCPLASFDDIEAMKAIAISQRGSAKDFIDLYCLLGKTGHVFNDLLKMVIKKYEVKENYEYQLKTSFTYFDDAEKEIDNILIINENNRVEKIKKPEWEKIKHFFYRITG